MEYSKGEWKLRKSQIGYLITADACSIATVYDEEYPEANAHLIVAAVNACTKLNPDNPIAVAESVTEMYEALQKIRNYTEALTFDHPIIMPQLQEIIDKALAKAEGR